ncbi:MAG: endonuclease/exonuclease/phosphatase family protein [Pseudomonadota bacterium]
MFSVRGIWPRAALAFIGLAGLITILLHLRPGLNGEDLQVYTKNLWWGHTRHQLVVDDILAANVDVVMLQEVSFRNIAVVELLKDTFPHQHICQFSDWSGVALLSKIPFSGPTVCSDWRGLAAAPIVLSGQKVWFASVHIPWPWPYEPKAAMPAIHDVLETFDAPAVLAGDFNMVPWSHRLNRIMQNTGTRLSTPAVPTLNFKGIPLPIDLVLAPGSGSVELRPKLGSDHSGLVARVRIF